MTRRESLLILAQRIEEAKPTKMINEEGRTIFIYKEDIEGIVEALRKAK